MHKVMLIYTHTSYYILLYELSHKWIKLFQMGQLNKINSLFYQGEMKSSQLKALSVDDASRDAVLKDSVGT